MRQPRPSPHRRCTAPCRLWRQATAAVLWWWSYQPQLGERRRNAVVLVLEELFELRTGHERVGPAVLHQRLLPLLCAVQILEHFDHRLLGVIGNPWWRKDSAPVGERQVDSRLLQRRRVDTLDTLLA